MSTIDARHATAVVTGHSRGIGEAIANRLLSRGIRVLGLSRHRNTSLAERYPTLRETELDIADSTALEHWLMSGALAEFVGGSETPLLVNNAGVLQPIGPAPTQDTALVLRAVAVNVA